MPQRTAKRIQERIKAVAADPTNHNLGVRPLTNRSGFRLRIGDWRVLFDLGAERLDVIDIETRGDVYKPRRRR